MMISRKEQANTMDSINFDTTFGSFLADLGSDLPAPGGGAVSGISGALGAALGQMVASLTRGRKKYEVYSENTRQCMECLADMIPLFMELSAKDASAYSSYMKAATMPNGSETEIHLRATAMQNAIQNSADIPYKTLIACSDALQAIESLYGKSNQTCVGDLAAGATELSSAARIAWLNVLANLPYFEDHDAAKKLYSDAYDTYQSVITRASALFTAIEHDLAMKL